jgi:lysophospholipase
MSVEALGGRVTWFDRPDRVRIRIAHWDAGERGTILLLNGRTEFIEKYRETIAALQSRGFAVWSLDWRGQGASTRPLPDPLAHYVRHFDEYLGDLEAILERHVLPSLRGRELVMIGHSMGGHLAARMLARRPEAFARAVLLSPMIGLRLVPVPGLARALAVGACLLPGGARRYALGASHAAPVPFARNRLTSCAERYAADLAFLTENPSLALNGVTWGWLRAAFGSIAALRDPRQIARIDMPTLVAVAGGDTVVDNAATRRFALRLRRGKLVTIPGARHELLREADAYRIPTWRAIDDFLEPVGR